MIHVAYAASNSYLKFAATSMLSMFENISYPPPSVTVHILHDNTLTLENRDKFNLIAGRYGQIVKFYNVGEICKDALEKLEKLFSDRQGFQHLTIAAFYRFFILDVVDSDIEKIIYLDSDLIVNLNVAELWQIELGEKPLAAVPEIANGIHISFLPLCLDNVIKHENYFNSGVMILNLKVLRNAKNKISHGIKFIADNPQYNLFDQDVLNCCFSEEYLKLPLKFNRFVWRARFSGENFIDKKIYHYNSHVLNLNLDDIFNKLWFKYFARTPFFNEETIGNLYKGVQQLYIEQKRFARLVSAIVSEKARAFFVTSNNLEGFKQLFGIKPDEEIILADSADSVRILINSMKNSAGKKIFFILSSEFPAVAETLTRAGFTFSEDFLNTLEFLSDAEGLPLNSYPLVKLL